MQMRLFNSEFMKNKKCLTESGKMIKLCMQFQKKIIEGNLDGQTRFVNPVNLS